MFGRKPAATLESPARIDSSELAYAAAWGKTYSEWVALTEAERRDMRDRVVYAPYFHAEGK